MLADIPEIVDEEWIKDTLKQRQINYMYITDNDSLYIQFKDGSDIVVPATDDALEYVRTLTRWQWWELEDENVPIIDFDF